MKLAVHAGDDALDLHLGSSVFTQGLDDVTNKTAFYHHYYELKASDGATAPAVVDQHLFGNGDQSGLGIYYRRRESPWKLVGKVSDIDTLRSTYGYNTHQFGYGCRLSDCYVFLATDFC
eukprot:m.188341 g.188341  ORF g.188341 m.188341 type:complete len:119 (-) comp16936_c0_seq51:437-793(-)